MLANELLASVVSYVGLWAAVLLAAYLAVCLAWWYWGDEESTVDHNV